MWRLLVIDKNSEIRDLVASLFDSAELAVVQPRSRPETMECVRKGEVDIAVISLGHNGNGGMEWTKEIHELNSKLPIICWDDSEPGTAIDLGVKDGVFDDIVPPINPNDFAHRVRLALKAAHDLKSRVVYGTAGSWEPLQEVLLGQSAGMQNVFSAIERLGSSDAWTFISGEAGTGKDLLARAIHHHSKRCDQFLITVDCQAQPETLARELFGQRPLHPVSSLQRAGGGTLFLDHIEEMPLSVQGKLVEVLQSQIDSIHRRDAPRVIAASTGKLEQALATRAFREDLLGLLSATRIDLPPLRNRLEDIPLLAAYFLGRHAAGLDQRARCLSLIVGRILTQYHWPGNVRELESVLRRSASSATADSIQLGDLPTDFLNAVGPALLEILTPGGGPKGLNNMERADFVALSRRLFEWARNDTHFQLIAAVERELVIHAMAETSGNRVQAAKLLGITRATLRKRLFRFKIQREVIIH